MAYIGPHVSHRRFTPEQDAEIAKLRRSGMTLAALCRQFGGSLPAMRNSLERSGVAGHTTGRPRWREFTLGQIREMGDLWESGKSQTAVARQFGTTQEIVSRLLIQIGHVPVRRSGNAKRENHGWWRGGRIGIQGYTAIRVEHDSPFAVMATRPGYVLEHRLVMAEALGRPLTASETVHHISGDRSDNRIENLQLRQGKHGKHQVFQCGDCGSHNIIPIAIAEEQNART